MIFSVLALLATIISMVVKTWKKSLIIQSFNCIFEGIYDILIKAYTGVILSLINLINLIRTYLFLNNNKFSKNIYNLILVIFELIIVISCVFTWNGYISLLPGVASMTRAYWLCKDDIKLIRISGVIVGILYGTYYIYYGSTFMIIGYMLILLTSIYALLKERKK